MASLEVGKPAPEFSLKDKDGKVIQLKDLRGQWVVLYFYPKDDTPGCTREACAFRDDHELLSESNAVVLGVSPDRAESHQKFAKKYELPFTLLSDEDHSVANTYGAWGEKSLYGRKFMGMIRSTFLIDPDGKIARVWPKVKVDGHSEAVREAIADAANAQSGAVVAKTSAKKTAPTRTKAAPAAKVRRKN
jgi:thioredoxin-dependent peroxiredoxin